MLKTSWKYIYTFRSLGILVEMCSVNPQNVAGSINGRKINSKHHHFNPPARRGCLKKTGLSEQHHLSLFKQLVWMCLGFAQGELNNIQDNPTLHSTAPKSFLSAVLLQWLQWAPGDSRGIECQFCCSGWSYSCTQRSKTWSSCSRSECSMIVVLPLTNFMNYFLQFNLMTSYHLFPQVYNVEFCVTLFRNLKPDDKMVCRKCGTH